MKEISVFGFQICVSLHARDSYDLVDPVAFPFEQAQHERVGESVCTSRTLILCCLRLILIFLAQYQLVALPNQALASVFSELLL